MEINVLNARPAGYGYLLEKLNLTGMPHWHSSYISRTSANQSTSEAGKINQVYPDQYWPGDKLSDHLEFALKYDGTSLGLLKQIFEHFPKDELIAYINSKPMGKYTRRTWFLFEFLTGETLPVDEITAGNYVDILDRDEYITISNGEKSRRHKVINNLLGPREYCPIVRKTEELSSICTEELKKKCEEIANSHPPELLRRAISYLYGKETKSSFEIEHIKPDASRTEKFITLLGTAEREDFCTKDRLIELQNRIVDPRFKDIDFRATQNYVGQTVSYQKELIHYICPKPEDLPKLMEGLIACHKRMINGDVSAIIHAALIAYGFVFLHPFEDGNGRIHRFLIHNILSIKGMVPPNLMFPVSAVMLKNSTDYDASLEAFSKPLLQLINYTLDEIGRMSVENNTASLYQYMDLTVQSEALYKFIEQTIKDELIEELSFLANYDRTKKKIQGIIDMPDRLIDLFINLCLQNNGSLSKTKRSTHFDFLSDKELSAMEQAIQEGYNQTDSST